MKWKHQYKMTITLVTKKVIEKIIKTVNPLTQEEFNIFSHVRNWRIPGGKLRFDENEIYDEKDILQVAVVELKNNENNP